MLNLNIRYEDGGPVDFKHPRGEPCLFILDDQLNDAYSSGLCVICLRKAVIIVISVSTLSRRTYFIKPSIVETLH